MALNFGLGQLVLMPSGATPTPLPVALLTDLSIDASYKEVGFNGPWQFAIEKVLAEGELKGKAKAGNINGALLSAALQGATAAAGQVAGVQGELAAIPATPYQVTATHSANFVEDLGILDLTANLWLTRVSGTPSTGQYSEAAGVYTFAAADTGHNVSLNYSYTISASGQTITLNNQLMGTTTVFGLRAYDRNVVGSITRYLGMQFPRAIVPKLSFAFKPTSFTEIDIEFSIMQDATSALVAKFYTQE